jgi:putative polyhydroxyalkanoate system protein
MAGFQRPFKSITGGGVRTTGGEAGAALTGIWAAAAAARNKANIFVDHKGNAPLEKCQGRADVARMSQPIDVDLPHNLGKDEARRRIANNIQGLERQIPGGANVESNWVGDRLDLEIAAMGERIHGSLDVQESKVHVRLALPGMLGMFGGIVAGALKSQGGLLLEDRSKG